MLYLQYFSYSVNVHVHLFFKSLQSECYPGHANDIVHHKVSCKLIIAKFTRYISVPYLLITSACIYYFGSLEPTLEVLKLSLYCSCLCDTLVNTTALFQTLPDYTPSSSFLCLLAQILLISDLNSFLLPASILLSLRYPAPKWQLIFVS